MKNLKLDEIQSYFDEQTEYPLSLWMGYHSLHVDGIFVELEGVPLLKNEENSEIHLPDRTKQLIKYFVQEAKKHRKPGVLLKPKELGLKRYDYATKFEFLYSQLDHEYIPGLARPWDEGFLTPVFFKLAALNKYSQNPDYELDLFSESYGSIRHNDWSIEFGINKNNKVIMWLGDIEKLPDSEKYYLRSENLPSDHDIHSEFYDAQIEIKWSEPSRQSSLFHLRKQLKEISLKKYDLDLYHLDGEVSKVIENLHRPVFWEDKHVGPVIESFNRVFVESLNSSAIKENIVKHLSTADVKGKGSLKLFEAWMKIRHNLEDISDLMCPFYVLYDFRIITCHLQSSESKASILSSINSRLGLKADNLDYETIYDTLIDLLAKSYSKLNLSLE